MWCGECLWFLACQAATRGVLAVWRPPAPVGACCFCFLPPPCPCLLQCATRQGRWLGVGTATRCPAVSQCLGCGVMQGRRAAALCRAPSSSSFCQCQRWLIQHEKKINGGCKGYEVFLRSRDFSCWGCDHPLFYHGAAWCAEHPG